MSKFDILTVIIAVAIIGWYMVNSWDTLIPTLIP